MGGGVRRGALALALGAVTCGSPSPTPPSAAWASPLPGAAAGWGAVFWREGRPVAVGGGARLIGPVGVADAARGGPGPCGGEWADGAPARAVLALPTGVHGDAPTKPPAVPAGLVEAAAWRLDEALPAAERFTPVDPAAAPARQRGVEVGSVIKLRRTGGPPVILTVGARGCAGAALLLDATGARAVDELRIPGACAPLKALPPADLDGDGALETALYSDEQVVLVRIPMDPARAALEALGSWSCPAGAP
jgi:hypothetical protein